MELLLAGIFLGTLLQFILQVSLLDRWWVKALYLLSSGVFAYFTYEMAIEQSFLQFKNTLGNSSTMIDFSVLLIIESAIGLLLSFLLIRQINGENVRDLIIWLRFFPGIVSFIAIFYLQSYIFLTERSFLFYY